MNQAAIIHRPTSDYIYPSSRNTLELQLITARGDADEAELWYWMRYETDPAKIRRQRLHAHQLFATMSSDEFKNGQKNSPSPGRRRTIMLLFSCHLDFSHKIISNPDFLFLFPINFWDFTSQNMAN